MSGKQAATSEPAPTDTFVDSGKLDAVSPGPIGGGLPPPPPACGCPQCHPMSGSHAPIGESSPRRTFKDWANAFGGASGAYPAASMPIALTPTSSTTSTPHSEHRTVGRYPAAPSTLWAASECQQVHDLKTCGDNVMASPANSSDLSYEQDDAKEEDSSTHTNASIGIASQGRAHGVVRFANGKVNAPHTPRTHRRETPNRRRRAATATDQAATATALTTVASDTPPGYTSGLKWSQQYGQRATFDSLLDAALDAAYEDDAKLWLPLPEDDFTDGGGQARFEFNTPDVSPRRSIAPSRTRPNSEALTLSSVRDTPWRRWEAAKRDHSEAAEAARSRDWARRREWIETTRRDTPCRVDSWHKPNGSDSHIRMWLASAQLSHRTAAMDVTDPDTLGRHLAGWGWRRELGAALKETL